MVLLIPAGINSSLTGDDIGELMARRFWAVVRPALCVALMAVLLCWTAPEAGAQAGKLDPSFGSGGVITMPNYLLGYGLGVRAGGQLVLSGISEASADTALARLLRNGRLDSTFGSNGTVADSRLTGENSDHALHTLAIQADGKIVLTDGGTIARYDANGTIDSTFGDQGYVSTGPVKAFAVALEGNGAIVIAGSGPAGDFAVERFTTSGVPNGYYEQQFDTGPNPITYSQATSLVVQPSGAVVAAGFAGTGGQFPPRQPSRVVVARFIGGGLDRSFGAGGSIVSQIGTGSQPWSEAEDVALDPHGRIVVAGQASNGSAHANAIMLARYTANGQPDRSFGSGGHEISPLGGALAGSPVALGVQADDDLVVASMASTLSAVTARYLPSGDLDPGYGRCGVTTNQFDKTSVGNSNVLSLLIQVDGKINVAGVMARTPSQHDTFVARFVGGVAAASIPPGWTATFGIPLPPPPTGQPLPGSPDEALKTDAALGGTAMSFTDYFEWATKLSLLLVPVAGEEIALVDATDIVSFLAEGGLEQIAHDPPARDYRSPVRLRRFTPPIIQAGRSISPRVAAAFSRYATAGAKLASLELAYVASVERAQGAYLAGNAVWFNRQARAARSFLEGMASALRQYKTDSTALANRLAGTPLSRLKLTAAQIAKARQAIAKHGLPASIIGRLRRLGLSRAQIAAGVRSALSHLSPRRLTFTSLLSSKPVTTILAGAAVDSQAAAPCSAAK
jgi:uncharacterized delta-60 repeat protein